MITSLRRTVLSAALLLTAMLAVGCSSTQPTPGRSIGSSEAASLAAQGAPSGVAAPSATAAGPSRTDAYLAQVGPKSCKPAAFSGHAALAGGAIDAYLTKPARAGKVDGGTAARAAAFVSGQLSAAADAVAACPAAKSLHSVSLQASRAYSATAQSLRQGAVASQRINADAAIYADVITQATRLRLTVTPKTPPVAQLKG